MTVIRAALLGFGTVGQGVYEAIETHQQRLQQRLGKKVEIAGVLIRDLRKQRSLPKHILVTDNMEDILAIDDLDIIFEAIVGNEPCYTYLNQAIEKGCHIITANKAMFAQFGTKLLEKAKQHHVQVGFEATTAGGVPIVRTIEQLLQVNQIEKVEAILNGTSNFILSEMRKNKLSFPDALQLAQERGYAEADPTNDIEGIDAFYKLMILSELIYGGQPEWETVEKQGIRTLTSEEVQLAEQKQKRYKQIASLTKKDGKVFASVKPILVDKAHPLYHVEDVDNAIKLETSLIGTFTLQGPGAGKLPTASAMVEDFIYVLEKDKSIKKQREVVYL